MPRRSRLVIKKTSSVSRASHHKPEKEDEEEEPHVRKQLRCNPDIFPSRLNIHFKIGEENKAIVVIVENVVNG